MAISVAPGATLAWVNTSGTQTYTWTGLNGGTNFPANTKVVLCIAGTTGSGTTNPSYMYNAVTIGGQAASFVGWDGVDGYLLMYQADMPGTSQTDSSVMDAGSGYTISGYMVAGCWILTDAAVGFTQTYGTNFGSNELENSDLGSDPLTITTYSGTYDGGTGSSGITITVPTGGVGLACIAQGSTTATGTYSCAWGTSGSSKITGAAGDITSTKATSPYGSFFTGHTLTAGAWGPGGTGTPNFTGSPVYGAAMVAATFVYVPAAPSLVSTPQQLVFM